MIMNRKKGRRGREKSGSSHSIRHEKLIINAL